VFNLAIGFVNGLDVFETSYDIESVSGDYSNSTFEEATQNTTGVGLSMSSMWGIVIVGVAGSLVIAAITHSVAAVGVYVFSLVFWASYTNMIVGILPKVLLGSIWGFVIIGTAAMLFIWVGAVVGMLSGSG